MTLVFGYFVLSKRKVRLFIYMDVLRFDSILLVLNYTLLCLKLPVIFFL